MKQNLMLRKTLNRILIYLLILFSDSIEAQMSFYIDESISFADLRIKIGENISLADVRVKIGEDVTMADFSVGITNTKSNANFIITESKYRADKTIKAGESLSSPDIRIRAGESVSVADVRIKIKSSGTVDYLVYTENDDMSLYHLVIALLPAINKEFDYKLEGVPTLSESGMGFGVPIGFAVIAHSTSTSTEASRVLNKIAETPYSLASKNLILVVCRSGLDYPLNSNYESLGELNADADSQLNISGENFHVYIFQMNDDGSISESQHLDYKAND